MSISNLASGFFDSNIWILLTHLLHLWLYRLSDYQRVSQTHNETLGLLYGSSNFQDERGFGSVPHRNMIFELQISHIQCYYGYHRILILIFLIVLRLFQSRDHTFFLTIIATVTESDWLCLPPKNSFRKWTEWGLSCKGGGGEGCRHNLRFSLDGSSKAGEKVAAGTKGKISRSWQLCLYINYLQLQTLTQIIIYFFRSHSWCL